MVAESEINKKKKQKKNTARLISVQARDAQLAGFHVEGKLSPNFQKLLLAIFKTIKKRSYCRNNPLVGLRWSQSTRITVYPKSSLTVLSNPDFSQKRNKPHTLTQWCFFSLLTNIPVTPRKSSAAWKVNFVFSVSCSYLHWSLLPWLGLSCERESTSMWFPAGQKKKGKKTRDLPLKVAASCWWASTLRGRGGAASYVSGPGDRVTGRARAVRGGFSFRLELKKSTFSRESVASRVRGQSGEYRLISSLFPGSPFTGLIFAVPHSWRSSQRSKSVHQVLLVHFFFIFFLFWN